jgi:drug/metabolite transporter (DMT)-like permease
MEAKEARIIVFAMLASILWGLSFPLIVLGLKDVSPLLFGSLRFIIAAPCLIGLTFFLYGKDIFKQRRKVWYKLCILGFTSVTFPVMFQNFGMLYTSAHVSSILQSTGPLLVLFLAFFLLGESLTKWKIIGIFLSLGGTYLVLMGQDFLSFNQSILGNSLILLSALSYSVASIIAKSCLAQGIKPIPLLTLSTIPGTLALVLLTPIFEDLTLFFSHEAWMTIVFLALGPSLIALILWYDAMSRKEISRLSFFIYLIPLFATVFSYFLLGEVIAMRIVIAACVIIMGVALAQFEG